MKSKGFTLIELMIAIAILAILFAIAKPAYNEYKLKQENARVEQINNTPNVVISSDSNMIDKTTTTPTADRECLTINGDRYCKE